MTYRGQHIGLRGVRISDARDLLRWENVHSEESSNLNARYTLSDITDYITAQRSVQLDGQLRFMIDDLTTGRSIGTVDLFEVDFEESTTRIGILIAEEADRGKGYAREAVIRACRHAIGDLGLKEVIAEVKRDNIPSQKLFTICGFSMEAEEGDILTYVLQK